MLNIAVFLLNIRRLTSHVAFGRSPSTSGFRTCRISGAHLLCCITLSEAHCQTAWLLLRTMLRHLTHRRWEESEVNQRLDTTMTDAFHAIWDVHEQKKVPLRTAAFIKALQRVTRVRSELW